MSRHLEHRVVLAGHSRRKVHNINDGEEVQQLHVLMRQCKYYHVPIMHQAERMYRYFVLQGPSLEHQVIGTLELLGKGRPAVLQHI